MFELPPPSHLWGCILNSASTCWESVLASMAFLRLSPAVSSRSLAEIGFNGGGHVNSTVTSAASEKQVAVELRTPWNDQQVCPWKCKGTGRRSGFLLGEGTQVEPMKHHAPTWWTFRTSMETCGLETCGGGPKKRKPTTKNGGIYLMVPVTLDVGWLKVPS